MFLPQEVIRKKRDGQKLPAAEIEQFIKGIVTKQVSEGQVASFCMATLLNGMEMDERVALTMAMAQSGVVMDWSNLDLDGPILDKHSTGGVGDKVSLLLAPVIAACGGYVPMISGRGLGHTGGTLDKMDAISGYVSQPDLETLRKVVKETGAAIIGATSDIAPADKTVYAIRDVTATVESIDLITASILSKKMAAGLDALVMDVKFGTGAFMQDYDDAKALAQSIVSVANGGGMPTMALLTDMNQVLGHSAGNAVEVQESVDFLKGTYRDPRLMEITVGLTAEMLLLGKLATDIEDARAKVTKVIENGDAAEAFAKMVHALGGAADFMDKPETYMAQADIVTDIYAEDAGFVTGIDTRAIGIGIVEMRGGRAKPTDDIDHAVGVTQMVGIGTKLDAQTPIAKIHARSQEQADKMAESLHASLTLSDTKPNETKTVSEAVYK